MILNSFSNFSTSVYFISISHQGNISNFKKFLILSISS